MIITDKATLRENEKYHTSESPHFLHYLCLVPNEYCTASPRSQASTSFILQSKCQKYEQLQDLALEASCG